MKLSLQAVSARHPAAKAQAAPALRRLSLQVGAGEQVAVIGPSGAGKTTLMHVAAAALVPAAGEFRLDGVEPWVQSARGLRALRRQLFLAPQVPPLPPRQRVITALLAARLPTQALLASLRSLFYPDDIAGAYDALDRFDLADKLFERVDRLSGGERQRVGLARALLSPASLWLIDEPLSALDPTRAAMAIETLAGAARERGVTLLATLHQVDMALAHFPRVVGLRDGELAFDLPTRDVTPERLENLYAQERATARPALDEDAPAIPPPAVMHCR